MSEPQGDVATRTVEAYRPTEQQVSFFEAFGFLHFPGLFADLADQLTEGFEEVFAEHATWDTNVDLHFEQKRSIIPAFVTKSEKLSALLTDPRVQGVVSTLLSPDHVFAESDGNIFSCETSWHADTYSAPIEQRHLKLSFYLDPISADSGAIRMIPGTNHYRTDFAERLRRDLNEPGAIASIFGVEPAAIPSWTLANEPGDLIVWNFRTIHASFNGGARRRLFSLNFRERRPDEDAEPAGP
jgi:hypothetical protein